MVKHGIEAGRRLLEDHRDVLADERSALAVGQGEQIPSLELQLSADPAGKGTRPITASIDALAGARFADDAEHLALFHRELTPSTARNTSRSGMETSTDRFVERYI